MGFSDAWNRTLVYFGIAEEDEDWDEDGYVTNEELERSYSDRPNVRRLSPRRRRNEFEDWTDPEPEAPASSRTAVMRPRPRAVDGGPRDARKQEACSDRWRVGDDASRLRCHGTTSFGPTVAQMCELVQASLGRVT
jgi:hypothetical protein